MTANYEQIIIGINTLILGTITTVVIIKNRNNGLRENLYNRQLDAFQSLYSKVVDLDFNFYEWIPLSEKYNDEKISDKEFDRVDEELEQLEEKIERLMDELDVELHKSQIIIPDEMAVVFAKFVIKHGEIEDLYFDDKLTKTELIAYSKEMYKLEDSIRAFIGLEKLSKENKSTL